MTGRARRRPVRRQRHDHQVPLEVHGRVSSADVGTAALVVGFGTALYAVGAGAYAGLHRPARVGGLGAPRRLRAARRCSWSRWRCSRPPTSARTSRSSSSRRTPRTDTPTFYKLTAMWSSQAGSLLLWVFLLSLFSSAVAVPDPRTGCARSRRTRPPCSACVAAFFLFLMLFYASPFATLANPPAEGNGLNPLLRHPAMMFHPPMLYTGYVGFTIPFAFAIGALLKRHTGPGVDPRDAPLRARRLDLPRLRDPARLAVVVLRARLGRLLGLGPGRERVADAVAHRHRVHPLDHGPGEARHAADLERVADRRDVHARAARHVPRALRASSTRSTPSARPRSASRSSSSSRSR